MSSPLYAGEVHYCGDDRQLQACDCKDATVTLCRLPFFYRQEYMCQKRYSVAFVSL